MQHTLVNAFNLTVTVAHYPAGASKWNPIEHRLFSEASKNWAGVPLETIETILNCLSITTTRTGLMVRATLVNTVYERGITFRAHDMEQLNIIRHEAIPQWNYTTQPQ